MRDRDARSEIRDAGSGSGCEIRDPRCGMRDRDRDRDARSEMRDAGSGCDSEQNIILN